MVEVGKVISIINNSDWNTQVVIRKKWNNAYVPICFTATNEQKRIISQIGLQIGDVVKINYHIFSKKYNDKYFTTAQIDLIIITQKKNPQLMVDLETGEIL